MRRGATSLRPGRAGFAGDPVEASGRSPVPTSPAATAEMAGGVMAAKKRACVSGPGPLG